MDKNQLLKQIFDKLTQRGYDEELLTDSLANANFDEYTSDYSFTDEDELLKMLTGETPEWQTTSHSYAPAIATKEFASDNPIGPYSMQYLGEHNNYSPDNVPVIMDLHSGMPISTAISGKYNEMNTLHGLDMGSPKNNAGQPFFPALDSASVFVSNSIGNTPVRIDDLVRSGYQGEDLKRKIQEILNWKY